MAKLSPNATKVLLLFCAVTGICIFAGNKIAGETGVGYGFLLAIVINIFIFFFAHVLVLKLFGAKEVYSDDEPLFHGTAAYLAERASIPKPRLYVIEEPTPNAFSVGLNPYKASIAITRGLLKLLDKDELGAVIAHEMVHIQKGDILVSTIAAGIGATVRGFANFIYAILMFGVGNSGNKKKGNSPIARFALSTISPLLAILIQSTIVRNRELDADEQGAHLCGEPEDLINALYKIEKARENHVIDSVEQNPFTSHLFFINPIHAKFSFYLFSTHPPVGERIQYLEDLVI